MSALIFWGVIFVVSSLIGGACALMLNKKYALGLSTLIPWLIFLVFNLYGEYNSPDKELMQGTWGFFQLTIGTLTAIFGLLSAICVMRWKAK
jgi:hypothetical protein